MSFLFLLVHFTTESYEGLLIVLFFDPLPRPLRARGFIGLVCLPLPLPSFPALLFFWLAAVEFAFVVLFDVLFLIEALESVVMFEAEGEAELPSVAISDYLNFWRSLAVVATSSSTSTSLSGLKLLAWSTALSSESSVQAAAASPLGKNSLMAACVSSILACSTLLLISSKIVVHSPSSPLSPCRAVSSLELLALESRAKEPSACCTMSVVSEQVISTSEGSAEVEAAQARRALCSASLMMLAESSKVQAVSLGSDARGASCSCLRAALSSSSKRRRLLVECSEQKAMAWSQSYWTMRSTGLVALMVTPSSGQSKVSTRALTSPSSLPSSCKSRAVFGLDTVVIVKLAFLSFAVRLFLEAWTWQQFSTSGELGSGRLPERRMTILGLQLRETASNARRTAIKMTATTPPTTITFLRVVSSVHRRPTLCLRFSSLLGFTSFSSAAWPSGFWLFSFCPLKGLPVGLTSSTPYTLSSCDPFLPPTLIWILVPSQV